MPAKSAKQFKFFEALAHGAKPKAKNKAGKFGPSKAVAEEMLAKTSHKKKSQFAKG